MCSPESSGYGSKARRGRSWVLECLVDPSPGELFVSSSVAVILESCEDVFPLLGSEELGSCGVVVYEEVRSNGRDDSQ